MKPAYQDLAFHKDCWLVQVPVTVNNMVNKISDGFNIFALSDKLKNMSIKQFWRSRCSKQVKLFGDDFETVAESQRPSVSISFTNVIGLNFKFQ